MFLRVPISAMVTARCPWRFFSWLLALACTWGPAQAQCVWEDRDPSAAPVPWALQVQGGQLQLHRGAQQCLLDLGDTGGEVLAALPTPPDSAWVLRRGGVLQRWSLRSGRLLHSQVLGARITAWAQAPDASGGVLAVAVSQPRMLVFFQAQGAELNRVPLRDSTGKIGGDVCALLVAPQRPAFIAAFAELPEIWELSLDPAAPDIGVGLVHDFQYREGHFLPGYLHPRRTALPQAPQAVALAPSGHELLLVLRDAGPGPVVLATHLDVRKPIARHVLGAPQEGGAEQPQAQGRGFALALDAGLVWLDADSLALRGWYPGASAPPDSAGVLHPCGF